ncbi:MAG TPA: endonuclease III [Thermodesulfobium narugense]|uniref:Endonuclease III n=1 Tax=Thermodesulfobium acidiphilum TaxID=1794699 RepID=A0A2R4VZF6_THEAF|nr:endonuclease III [Thermodesulfobium acidiphilum]AWB09925.1 DNA-(apurinic or apyrimidinic site) lyase /endonuclease III [Thermodesulfobium acidiphilum]PMP86640.1 MAG: endonuclease III [Thermodesulfobium narugense]HEM55574.1 endonuclease III [Thermodesulfobium narugense]
MVLNKTNIYSEILHRLNILYPEIKSNLNFNTPFEFYVAIVLAAQCTDEKVNTVTKELFKRIKSFEDLDRISLEELEEAIHSTGFYHNKAKSLKEGAKYIIKHFNSTLPNNFNDLIKIPGLGRKSSYAILGYVFNKSAIVVDTHVKRLAMRLALVKKADPITVEREISSNVEEKNWFKFSYMLNQHGRTICTAKNPKCQECILNDICPKVGISNNK